VMKACEVLAYDFRITRENAKESREVDINKSRIPARIDNSESRPITHAYSCPKNTFYVTSMDKEMVSTYGLTFIG